MKLFPDTWQLDEVKSLCDDVVDCINKTAPIVDYETPYKMIRTTNVKSGWVNLDEVNYVDEATFIKWNRRLTPKRNDIVLTREAPLGDVGLIRSDEKVFLGQRTMIYRADNIKLDQHFLYYSLQGPTLQAQIKMYGSGSTVEHMRVPDAEKLVVPYPPIEVQKKISSILSAYDDLIDNNKRRIALLEKLAEEIYREWFVRFRFPGYQDAKFEKGIPKEWKESSLSDIASFVMGQSPKSEFYNDQGEGLPFHQGVGTYGERFPVNETYCSVEGRKANAGDILFSVRAPVGRLNIADTKMIIGRGLAAISHKKGWNSYLYYLLRIAFANEDIIGNGAIFNSVGKDELMRFKILLPSETLIKEYQEKAAVMDENIKILIKSNQNLIKSKEMLLPRLISGKLSVADRDIQFPPSMVDDAAA